MSFYLDYNASAPIDRRVLDVMTDVYLNHYGNADSRTHVEGNGAREIVEQAREQMAQLLGLSAYEVFFTGGATESDNLAILGMAQWGKEQGKNHIITSAIEHKAILEPLHFLEGKGFQVDYVSPDSGGRIQADDIKNRVNERTLMVCMMHANNETGVLQPAEELGDYLAEQGVYFLVDAAQTCGKLVPELKRCRYDFLSASAHKFHGPQGIGILAVKRRNLVMPPIRPIMFGGGQENGLRPGTLPVALIAGMGCAGEIAEEGNAKWRKKTAIIKENCLSLLRKSSVKYEINGNQQYCMTNTINVSFNGIDSEALMLAMKGVCSFSNGSACTAKDYSVSYVLSAMGLPKERVECAVRLSWDLEDIGEGFEEIVKMAGRLQR